MNIEPNQTVLMGQRPPSWAISNEFAFTSNLTQKIKEAENSKNLLEKTFGGIRSSSEQAKDFLFATSSKIGEFAIDITCAAGDFYSSITNYQEWKELSQQMFDSVYIPPYNEDFDAIEASESRELLDFEKCYFPSGNNTRHKTHFFFRDNGIPILIILSSLLGFVEFSHLANKNWKRGCYKTSACYFSFAILTGSIGSSILFKSPLGPYVSRNKKGRSL